MANETTTIKIMVSGFPTRAEAIGALARAVEAIGEGEQSIYQVADHPDLRTVVATVTEAVTEANV